MKKLAIMVLYMSISSICWGQTNENDSIPANLPAGSIYEVEETPSPIVKSYAPRQAFYMKNGKAKISHRFFAGPIFGKDDVMSPTFAGNTTDEFAEKVTEQTESKTNIGFSLDYRIAVTPGKTSKDLCFTPNPWGLCRVFWFYSSR